MDMGEDIEKMKRLKGAFLKCADTIGKIIELEESKKDVEDETEILNKQEELLDQFTLQMIKISKLSV